MKDKNYILDSLKNLDNYSINIETLASDICNKICKEYNIQKTDDLENNIKIILTNYRYGLVDNNMVVAKIDDVINSVIPLTPSTEETTPVDNKKSSSGGNKQPVPEINKEIKDNQSSNNVDIKTPSTEETTPVDNKKSSSGGNKQPVPEIKKENKDNHGSDIVDVDTDIVIETSGKYEDVESGVKSAEINIPSVVAPYSAPIEAAVSIGMSGINSALAGVKQLLIEVVNKLFQIDNDSSVLDSENSSFGDIKKIDVLSNRKGKKLADEKFFIELAEVNKNCKVENGIVTIGEYQYDIKKKKLYYNDSSVKVDIYIPETIMDIENKEERLKALSETNTVTLLAPSGLSSVSAGKPTTTYFNDYATNSIIITPYKDEMLMKKDKYASYVDPNYNMTNQVIETTKFTEAFTNQKSGSKNYIMGCSNGGYSAFKIGVSDTYDGVIVVNSVPIINGVQTPKGAEVTDENLKSYAESGKPILFISSAKDGEGKSIPDVAKGMEIMNSGRYDGINVKWATNNVDIDRNSPYVVSEEFWRFATNKGSGVSDTTDKLYAKQYTQHGSFYGMTRDFISKGLLDGNEYNNGVPFDWDEIIKYLSSLELN